MRVLVASTCMHVYSVISFVGSVEFSVINAKGGVT